MSIVCNIGHQASAERGCPLAFTQIHLVDRLGAADEFELVGSIDARLAADARHHGQDLVEELFGQTLKQAERGR